MLRTPRPWSASRPELNIDLTVQIPTGCLLQKDKELILGLIETEMGVDRFNAELQEKLLGCMRQTVAAVVWKQTED